MNAGLLMDAIALVAIAMIFYGCYLLLPAAAWIVVGSILLTLTLLAARGAQSTPPEVGEEENTGG